MMVHNDFSLVVTKTVIVVINLILANVLYPCIKGLGKKVRFNLIFYFTYCYPL